MKIAVVGGGIYGISVATRLAKEHAVDLYEQNKDILMAASGINQFRLHRGFHYPRSSDTAVSLLNSERLFFEEYGNAIISSTENYYGLSKRNSLTTADEFMDFCKKHNLDFEIQDSGLLNKENLDLCIKVKENLLDPLKLKKVCWNKLKSNKVNVLLKREFFSKDLANHDFVINCTYAYLNKLLGHIPTAQKEYQFELCEKPLIQLPEKFKNKSIVIIDGPFMCVDPYGSTGFFLMGNVVHAIHQANVGKHPEINEEYFPLLNKGIIRNPKTTNFDQFIEAGSEFIPEIKHAKHIGSMFTIRTVLPNVEATDERPTIVEKIDDKIINVFAGKIGTCVSAAESVKKLIKT